ncbi:hypothetical protein JMUB7527_28670 [Staphylococcus aureus]
MCIRDSGHHQVVAGGGEQAGVCLLYTSDAADDMQCVDLGGRRIIKKTSVLPLSLIHI